MKKILLAAVILLFGYNQTQAQVTFKPGIRAGANFSHFTEGDGSDYYYNSYNEDSRVEFKSKTDFYIGFYGALRLTKFYTLQPEITYSRQGSKYHYSYRETIYDPVTNFTSSRTMGVNGQYDLSYLSVAVTNKFTFNEKFNVHVGPTIDFVVEKGGDWVRTSYSNGRPTDVDLAFFAGIGFNFTPNFGLEARVKKGIVPVIDTDYNDHTNVNFSVGATYTFDIK